MGTRRKYETTHPWIRFRLDLSKAPADLWILLGEARSKLEHLAGVPLHPSTAAELYQVYLAKGIMATTAIEGNTLTEEQVQLRLEGTLELPPSQQYLGEEIDNIVQALNHISEDLHRSGPKALTPEMIKEFDRLVLKGMPIEPEVVPGEIRTHSVVVGGYRAAPAEDCQYLLERLVDWLNGPDFAAPGSHPDMKMVYAIIRAIIAHLYLAWIHPFGDGNGRTSRLLEFQILVASGSPFPATHLLSSHYNQTRSEYYRQLDLASRSGGDLIPFLRYAVAGFVDGLREQLTVVWAQQMQVAWEYHVYETFRDRKSPSNLRRRALVLELGQRTAPTPRFQLPMLSRDLAQAYETKTGKTLTRDLNALQHMGLIRKSNGGWEANLETVLGILPKRVPEIADASGT